MMRALLALLLSSVLLVPRARGAEGLTPALTRDCLLATVKVGTLNADGEPVGSGSGTMIDKRGYVLTNFHVVGNTVTGRLWNPDGEVLLATTSSDSDVVSYDWQGKVVRADARLDLALIRVTATRAGQEASGGHFHYIRMSDAAVHPGAQVWTFGFPSGSRTVNITGGVVAGLEVNLAGETSWIRTDAAFNPGNSGGLLVDDRGQLVGVPTQVLLPDGKAIINPINVARAVGRVPAAWLGALNTGDIDNVRASGAFNLLTGVALHDELRGDNMLMGQPERRLYLVSGAVEGEVTASPTLPMVLLTPEGKQLRMGWGRLALAPTDPLHKLVGVLLPAEVGEPVNLTLTLKQQKRPFSVPTFDPAQRLYVVPPELPAALSEDLSGTKAALARVKGAIYVALYGDVVSGAGPGDEENFTSAAASRVMGAWRDGGHLPEDAALLLFAADQLKLWVMFSKSLDDRIDMEGFLTTLGSNVADADSLDAILVKGIQTLDQTLSEAKPAAEVARTATVRAAVVDAMTGKPLQATVLIGNPGAPLQTTVEAVQAGKAQPSELRAAILTSVMVNDGRVEITKVPAGATYPYAILAEGYKPRFGTIELPEDGKTADLGQIELVSRAL